jgi:hypothetical protein
VFGCHPNSSRSGSSTKLLGLGRWMLGRGTDEDKPPARKQ